MKKALLLSVLILQVTGIFAQKFTGNQQEFKAVKEVLLFVFTVYPACFLKNHTFKISAVTI
jgi:hypothetical protein